MWNYKWNILELYIDLWREVVHPQDSGKYMGFSLSPKQDLHYFTTKLYTPVKLFICTKLSAPPTFLLPPPTCMACDEALRHLCLNEAPVLLTQLCTLGMHIPSLVVRLDPPNLHNCLQSPSQRVCGSLGVGVGSQASARIHRRVKGFTRSTVIDRVRPLGRRPRFSRGRCL